MKTIGRFQAVAIIVIFLTTLSGTCKKSVICGNSISYSFQMPGMAYPARDSIHIGDTIWLESNASNSLRDILSGNIINYSNAANLGMVVTMLQFLNANVISGAINKFNLIIFKGKIDGTTNPSSNNTYLFTEENNYYSFKLAIVPNDTGRFVLTISNSANVFRRGDVCTKANFEIDFENTNQHFYWLQQWRPDLVLDDIGKLKVYYFKVY